MEVAASRGGVVWGKEGEEGGVEILQGGVRTGERIMVIENAERP